MNKIIARGDVPTAIRASKLSEEDKAGLLGRYSRAHQRLRRGTITIEAFEIAIGRIIESLKSP